MRNQDKSAKKIEKRRKWAKDKDKKERNSFRISMAFSLVFKCHLDELHTVKR
jgi:hypothetical protein